MQIKELEGLFTFAVSAAEAGAAKPDAKPFLMAAAKAGVQTSEMIYVGDNYKKDVEGSKGVGMRAIWVRTPPPQNPEFILGTTPGPAEGESIADWEVESVNEMLQLDLSFSKL